MSNTSTPSDVRFTVTRTVKASRELVFKAWTEAERLNQWFGPVGLTLTSLKLDLRPGGVYHYGMTSPDGHSMWGQWEFREVEPPEKLVFVQSFADEQGNKVRPPWTEVWPLETLSEIFFAEADGQTTITLIGTPIDATEAEASAFAKMHSSMQQGWNGTFNQLDNYLAQA